MRRKIIGFMSFFIGACFGFMACNFGNIKVSPRKEQARSLSKTTSSKDKSFVDLKESVVYKGDTTSFKLLKEQFQGTAYPYELLYYAIVMANKYDYVPANYDVYTCVQQLVDKAHLEFNERTWMFVSPFLEKGAKAGDNKCKEVLALYYHDDPTS